MKIALVAYYFQPDEIIGAVRPDNWAKWLGEHHEVVVVTREMSAAEDKNVQGYRVVRPSSILTRLISRVKLWRRQMCEKKLAKDATSPPISAEATKKISGAFVIRMPCMHDVWFFACYRTLRRERPDLVIATLPPYVSLVAAWIYTALNSRTKLWLDFRDLWYAYPQATGVPCFKSIERWLEAKALSRADLVSTVSNGLFEYFRGKVTNDNRVVIYNSPTEAVNFVCAETSRSSGLVICYAGNIYNGFRDPTPLFEMFAELRESIGLSPRQVQLKAASLNPGNLLSLAARRDVTEFVDFVGALPRDESIRMQSEADVLLLLESPSPEVKGVLTGKVFEYLATDKPILLIGPKADSELHRLLDRHRRLISLEQIVAVLTGKETLPAYTAVDYSIISRRQLLDAVNRLDDQ